MAARRKTRREKVHSVLGDDTIHKTTQYASIGSLNETE